MVVLVVGLQRGGLPARRAARALLRARAAAAGVRRLLGLRRLLPVLPDLDRRQADRGRAGISIACAAATRRQRASWSSAHFVIPFFALLPYAVKQSARVLRAIAVWLLVAHYVDVHWLIAPRAAPALAACSHWLDLAALLAWSASRSRSPCGGSGATRWPPRGRSRLRARAGVPQPMSATGGNGEHPPLREEPESVSAPLVSGALVFTLLMGAALIIGAYALLRGREGELRPSGRFAERSLRVGDPRGRRAAGAVRDRGRAAVRARAAGAGAAPVRLGRSRAPDRAHPDRAGDAPVRRGQSGAPSSRAGREAMTGRRRLVLVACAVCSRARAAAVPGAGANPRPSRARPCARRPRCPTSTSTSTSAAACRGRSRSPIPTAPACVSGDLLDGKRRWCWCWPTSAARCCAIWCCTGWSSALRGSGLRPGRDVRAVTISIDPHDTPRQRAAAADRASDRARRRDAGAAGAWPCARPGEEPQIRALAEALGFRYVFDPRSEQYAHPACAFVLTPDGRISRYLYGTTLPPARSAAGAGRGGGGAHRRRRRSRAAHLLSLRPERAPLRRLRGAA